MNISVIVPTRNRAKDLRVALDSVVNQSFKLPYEVVVVDNGSTDQTKEVVEVCKVTAPSHVEVRYLFEPMPGLLSGRHLGAQKANSDILTFIDDDIKADPGWLESIVTAFMQHDVQMVGGPSYPMYEVTPPVWESGLWTKSSDQQSCPHYSLIDLGPREKHIEPSLIWGLNFSIRKSVLFECGGFHPDCVPASLQRFQGDGETGLTEKFKAKSYKAWYAPGARVGHLVSKDRLTIDYVYKRQYYLGVCNSYALIRKTKLAGLRLMMKHPRLFVRFFNERLLRDLFAEAPKDELSKALRDGYRDGFWFHQKEAASDSKLMSWILKKDYWDYALPTEHP